MTAARGVCGLAPTFDGGFQAKLVDLFRWRRDVRRFRPDPVAREYVEALIATATLAPSVGYSQPWRFVCVEAPERRQAIIANFKACNSAALAAYDGERAALYAALKLAGLCEAPVHLAVFSDHETEAGAGLGRMTMPETLDYSVVAAIQLLWLAARAQGLGLGWVSILDPRTIATTLDVPTSWKFIAYLCLGYPEEEHLDPELVRHQWQACLPQSALLHQR